MATGLLEVAEANGKVHIVPMDHVQFISFQETRFTALGTKDLTGCTVVVVASGFGAVLAHIPPRPPGADPSDVHAGDRHGEELMDRLVELYHCWQSYFPVGPDTWVICAVHKGVVALPDQKRIIEAKLLQTGFTHFSSILYVVDKSDDLNVGRGTVLVDWRGGATGQKPAVYVEDRMVSESQPLQFLVQQQRLQPPPPLPPPPPQGPYADHAWGWDATYLRYRRLEKGKWIWAPQ